MYLQLLLNYVLIRPHPPLTASAWCVMYAGTECRRRWTTLMLMDCMVSLSQQMKRVKILAFTHVVLGCDRVFSLLFHAPTADLKTTARLTISYFFSLSPRDLDAMIILTLFSRLTISKIFPATTSPGLREKCVIQSPFFTSFSRCNDHSHPLFTLNNM